MRPCNCCKLRPPLGCAVLQSVSGSRGVSHLERELPGGGSEGKPGSDALAIGSVKRGAFDSHFHFLPSPRSETPRDLAAPARPQEPAGPCGARGTKNFGRDVPAAAAAAVKPPNFPETRVPGAGGRSRLREARGAGRSGGGGRRGWARRVRAAGGAARAAAGRASRGGECARPRVRSAPEEQPLPAPSRPGGSGIGFQDRVTRSRLTHRPE